MSRRLILTMMHGTQPSVTMLWRGERHAKEAGKLIGGLPQRTLRHLHPHQEKVAKQLPGLPPLHQHLGEARRLLVCETSTFVSVYRVCPWIGHERTWHVLPVARTARPAAAQHSALATAQVQALNEQVTCHCTGYGDLALTKNVMCPQCEA